MNRKFVFYEIIMAMLSLLVVFILTIQITINLTPTQSLILDYIDTSIWTIFLIDYIVRLFLSKNKWSFIKNNKLDLIAIIPINSLLKSIRIVRLSRLVKLIKFTKFLRTIIFFSKFKSKINKFITTNNLNYVIFITILIVFSGAIGISIAENMSFGDAIWWAYVTATTVGYGDISPATGIGRIIAAVLMLVGIGFIGMLTGTIATFFLDKKTVYKSYKEEIIEGIKNKLDEFDKLDHKDIDDMYAVLKSLKNDN
ncbi:potassium channel protein [Clostridium polyendosporum]|uniref:Potassium channel protein n=1 Tax=Clostridium polyendosporum TaxID=69208 RepID=A0A919S2L0_9CLOT|nr:potassium channel family protein [Clostridium polyendosporum]GIM30088.1 potassium channel protein [Clostridium polyendosporum]